MAMMPTLHRGSKGPAVKRWQLFLRGEELYFGKIDSDFGPKTEKSTRALQRRANREGFPVGKVDGWVGTLTYAYAATEGFELAPRIFVPGKKGAGWPAKPAGLRTLGPAGRRRVFGNFKYVSAPRPRNPEAIRITDRGNLKLVNVHLPDLIGVNGFPRSANVLFHAKGAEALRSLVAEWRKARLLHLVEGWSGGYVPRYIRGSTTRLSSHSWGSAFDINYPWNKMRQVPALVGEYGSVRELVPLAVDHGFYWGGWFGRLDGMHFELVKLNA